MKGLDEERGEGTTGEEVVTRMKDVKDAQGEGVKGLGEGRGEEKTR